MGGERGRPPTDVHPRRDWLDYPVPLREAVEYRPHSQSSGTLTNFHLELSCEGSSDGFRNVIDK